MNPAVKARRSYVRNGIRLVSLGVVVSAMLALAACTGSNSGNAESNSGNVSEPAGNAGTASQGIAHATAQVETYSRTSNWVAPGPAFNARKAAGKTIWYIPSDYSVPIFHTIVAGFNAALSHVGVHLTVCDGKGNPAQFATCMNEAVAQNAGAIIFDSLYPETISTGIAAAAAKNIPVIMANDQSPGGPLPSGYPGITAQVSFEYTLSGRLVADWIIKDSNGHANVLLTDTTDNPNSKSVLSDGYLYELQHYCPGCKETVKQLTISEWASQLPSITTSALTSDPTLSYVVPEYDGMTAFMGPAIQQMGKAESIKVATFNADLQQMQEMKSGQMVYVDVGSNNAYEGWAFADQALRLMAGLKPVADEHIPVFVFTRDNVGSISLTTAAANAGSWYGGTAYQGGYLKLWGVS